MKRITIVSLIMAVLVPMLLVSCKEPEAPSVPAPTIEYLAETHAGKIYNFTSGKGYSRTQSGEVYVVTKN